MNLQYIRYALEIARTGSISKAAENLSVAQPNLSRAVKELESGLGIAIFERTRTGMAVTPDGEKLLSAGERILHEMDELENMFDGNTVPRETLSLSFPPADYIAYALAVMSRDLPADGRYDLTFREVGAQDAIQMVAGGESRLGIIRIPAHNEQYYTERLAERELASERIAALPAVVLTCAPLSRAVSRHDLQDLTPVCTPDMTPTPADAPRKITADAPALLRTLLLSDPSAYALSLPLPPALMTAPLRQYPLADADMTLTPAWTDLFIYPKFYRLSALDRRLLAQLQKTAAECML